MNAKRISSSLVVITAVTVLVVLALRVRIGATADSVAVLKTTGMTCGSCSSKITKALERVKGVAVTEVDVEGGWVVVGFDTKIVKPEALAEKVNYAGFDCKLHTVLTLEQFKQATGRNIGGDASSSGSCGCGGTKGGSGTNKQN